MVIMVRILLFGVENVSFNLYIFCLSSLGSLLRILLLFIVSANQMLLIMKVKKQVLEFI
jgi:hypothetical protein